MTFTRVCCLVLLVGVAACDDDADLMGGDGGTDARADGPASDGPAPQPSPGSDGPSADGAAVDAFASDAADAAPPADGATGDGSAAGDGGGLAWYWTCGDPVCQGYSPTPGVPGCTTETAGQACSSAGATCDPMDTCNRKLRCTDSDPTQGVGGCPISSTNDRMLRGDLGVLQPAMRAPRPW